MCGRYVLKTLPDDLRQSYPFEGDADFGASFNIAPTHCAPIIFRAEGHPICQMARWGLVPAWSKEIGTKPLNNARADSVLERPSFAESFKRRRCLVPANGFFEWQAASGSEKTPFHIHRPDNGLFFFAGLFDSWQDQAHNTLLVSYAILTTHANHTLEAIHTRMPVVIPPEAQDFWLHAGADETNALQALMTPAPEEFFVANPISTRVNRVDNNDADLLTPTKPRSQQMSLL